MDIQISCTNPEFTAGGGGLGQDAVLAGVLCPMLSFDSVGNLGRCGLADGSP
jgi:hypothetical protein